MEDFKGTKGKWSLPHFADPNSKCKCGYVLCEQYCGSVTTVNYSNNGDDWRDGDYPPIEEAKYNAYLISAAPELLEACKLALGGIDNKSDVGVFIIKAINKALGKDDSHE